MVASKAVHERFITELFISDFIAIYKRKENDTNIVQVFHAEMEPSDKGSFESIVFQDVTADGFPEISVQYCRANVGMRSWTWKVDYRIFNGRPPYKVIFEYPLGKGWGDAQGNGEAEISELVFKKLDDDKPQLIKVISRKGIDRANTERIDQPENIFKFVGGRFIKSD